MRISDWSSDVCSSDLKDIAFRRLQAFVFGACLMGLGGALLAHFHRSITPEGIDPMIATFLIWIMLILGGSGNNRGAILGTAVVWIIWSRSEEHTSELQSLMRISYAVFCLPTTNNKNNTNH